MDISYNISRKEAFDMYKLLCDTQVEALTPDLIKLREYLRQQFNKNNDTRKLFGHQGAIR